MKRNQMLLKLLSVRHFFSQRFNTAALTVLLSFMATHLSADWKEEIKKLAEAHEGKVGLVFHHPASEQKLEINPDEVLPTASLIKLPLMIEAYRQSDAGKLDLAKHVELTKDDKVGGSGVLTYHFSDGIQLPVRDYIRLMMIYSDNTATNIVAEETGLAATSTVMKELGFPETQLNAKVFKASTTSIDPERTKLYGLGSTTAAEIALITEKLWNKEFATPESTELMLAHMRANVSAETVRRFLPRGTKVGYKGGAVNQVRTAAGFIELESGPLFFSVLTSDNKDQRWTDENEGEILIANVCKIAFDHFKELPKQEKTTAEQK